MKCSTAHLQLLISALLGHLNFVPGTEVAIIVFTNIFVFLTHPHAVSFLTRVIAAINISPLPERTPTLDWSLMKCRRLLAMRGACRGHYLSCHPTVLGVRVGLLASTRLPCYHGGRALDTSGHVTASCFQCSRRQPPQARRLTAPRPFVLVWSGNQCRPKTAYRWLGVDAETQLQKGRRHKRSH